MNEAVSHNTNENPYKVVTQLATKYSSGVKVTYDQVLDDLRELMVLSQLDTALKIKAHELYVDMIISNTRRIRSGEVIPMKEGYQNER